ncbi:MAG: FAD-binding oxidoreductase [Armatimonadetes bacterium]|nr:FAD-binding oxidoreductase [Armatimonadota bacterium]
MRTADVAIIGGGVVGLSIAYHLLKRQKTLRVVVLEREPMVGTVETARATGGIRHQFGTEVNIRLTQLSIPFFQHMEEETGVSSGFVPHGYLFVTASAERVQAYQANVALQRRLGVDVRLLTPDEIGAAYPWMRNDDLVGGTLCMQDGSADPYSVVQGLYRGVRTLGGEVLTQEEVTEIAREKGRITGVRTPNETVAAPVVVSAAGPYTTRVAALVSVDIPVKAERRQVVVAVPLPEIPEDIPFSIDGDTGWYVHMAGKSAMLLGGTDKTGPPDPTVDWSVVEDNLQKGVQRVPAMERVQVMRAYAGLRSTSPDYQAIVGPVPEVPGFYVAAGFSGHGFMHGPAAGQVMAEMILDGRATSVDAAPLSPTRFREGRTQGEAVIF